MCVYIYIYTHTHIYIYIYIHTHTYIYEPKTRTGHSRLGLDTCKNISVWNIEKQFAMWLKTILTSKNIPWNLKYFNYKSIRLSCFVYGF